MYLEGRSYVCTRITVILIREMWPKLTTIHYIRRILSHSRELDFARIGLHCKHKLHIKARDWTVKILSIPNELQKKMYLLIYLSICLFV
jgi:hypothetical protein